MEFKDAVADQRSEHQKQIDALKAERDRYKLALKEYADKTNWGIDGFILTVGDTYMVDQELAEEALTPAPNVGGKS